MTAVADDHFFNFLETTFINQHAPHRRLTCDLRTCRTEAQDISGFGDDDFFADDGSFLHEFRVTVKLPIGPMNWNKIFGLHQCHHQLQFLFAGMPAYMHRRLASIGVIHFGAPAIEMIHHPADGAFVAWDLARGEDDRIAFLDLEIFMAVKGKP